jgi:adenylate cyclase
MSQRIVLILLVCATLVLAAVAVWLQRWDWHPARANIDAAWLLLGLGEHADAADVADQVLEAPDDPINTVYNAACVFAQCVPLAERDKEKAQDYADRAVATLRLAVQNGYKDLAHMRQDKDLDPVRSHPEFQKLLKELEDKAN